MRKILSAALAGAAVIVSGSAIADDSTAMLGAGGLQFTKAADIRMSREDLFMSPNKVRIRYEFTNDGTTDVDSIVAFPLPDIDNYEFKESPVGTIGEDPINFVGFTAMADGKKVPVQVEQRAFVGNRDVTAMVLAAGLPVNLVPGNSYDKLDKLAPAKKKMLEKAGLAENGGDDNTEFAKWTARTKFYWTQHFPAGKTIVIEHSYTPVTGQTFFTDMDLSQPDSADGRHWQRDYCMDKATLTAIRAKMKLPRKGQDQGLLNISSTDFILKTANNWKGGIGVLHLTVDKLKPDNILSMCWAGDLKKTGATTFESTLNNVQPVTDIKMVVLE